MVTVFSSGRVSKASGWVMNFSPFFRFKHSYKTEPAVSSPSLVHMEAPVALPPAPYFGAGKVTAYQIINTFLCPSIKILLISAGLVSCVTLEHYSTLNQDH